MTREEFQKIVDDVTGGQYFPGKRKNSYTGSYGPTQVIKVTWLTGGAWGGNCWGNDAPESYQPTPEPEPELTDLDTILERIVPDISFMQYKKLMQKVKYDTKIEYEYYGNHTSYGTKEISVDDVWEFLKERNYV